MRSVTLSVVLFGVLVAGFVAGAWYSQRESVGAAGPRSTRILYYVDPMHPAYKSGKPGIAPDCGMPLRPVYEDAVHRDSEGSVSTRRAGTIGMDPEQQQLVGVRVMPVEKTAATAQLRLYGRVVPDETRLYRVDVGINGFIRDVSAVTTGTYVRKNQWLASLTAPEARSPIQGYLAAVDVLERTRKDTEGPVSVRAATSALQLMADRLQTIGVSSVQIDEINQTREAPPTIKVVAPADGFVVARTVSTGQKIDRGAELFRIADLSRVWIIADIFGPEAAYVGPGAIARVTVPGRTTAVGAMVGGSVLPPFDSSTQSATLRLEADNRGYVFRPDMFVDVDLSVALPPAIAVPADAIVDSGLKRTVFVERRAGVFEPREVETGWRLGGRVQIVKGLSAGERVVVAGAFVVNAEHRIRTSITDDRSRP